MSMRCLLCLATVLIVTKLQRVAFVTGVVTFNGNNTTPLNTSQTVVTQHVYQAYTALSLISLYRSDTAEPFTNFQSKIDVVEGTALEALPFMANILEDRPKIFKSQDAANTAIQWSIFFNQKECPIE